jgi:hypothetical protein
MVLVLGSALDLPLRSRNALLEAARFSAAYRDEPLDAPDATSLRHAVGLILEALEPNGAVACDRAGNLFQSNRAAARLFALFADTAAAPLPGLSNPVLATLHPAGLRPAIVNFEEVAVMTLERLRAETLRYPDDPRFAALYAEIAHIPDLPRALGGVEPARGPFLTVHLRHGPFEARIFSTISTIGTPTDATAEEIRIETYFPADEPTATLLRSRTSRRTSSPLSAPSSPAWSRTPTSRPT